MARTKSENVRPRILPLHANTSCEFEAKYPVEPMTPGRGGAPSLCDLPDELLLHTVSHLLAMRLDKPQSQAFTNKEKETDRQYENYYRRTALHALCLTSKRLNRLAVPALYNAITGSTTQYGITPLRLVWRTLTEKEELRSHVQYVENLLSDYLGNNLIRDVEAQGAEDMVSEYFEKLADVICMCDRIQQMSIISIESRHFSLWEKLLVPVCVTTYYGDSVGRLFAPRGGLRKLERLAFQTNAKEYERPNDWSMCFANIFFALRECPSLTELRVSGAVRGQSIIPPQAGSFKHLQRLEIMECTLALRDINDALLVCDSLRHLICHWAYLDCATWEQTLELLPNLSRQRKSLETLWLVATRVGFSSESGVTHLACPDLRQMVCLKELKLCNLFLPDRHSRLFFNGAPAHGHPVSAAPKLPPSLEHLTISYSMHCMALRTWRLAVVESLHQLAVDCPRYLPRLRELLIHFEDGSLEEYAGDYHEHLSKIFDEKGIRLSAVERLDFVAALG